MQTFVIKKLAEVQAFVNLSNVIVKLAGGPFTQKAPKVAADLKDLKMDIKSILKDKSDKEIFETKVSKTTNKLNSMMELYIGDEWDNPVEVLEWLSFYSGAAAAHAALVHNALDSSYTETKLLAKKLSDDYLELLDNVISVLSSEGKTRAKLAS